MPTTLDSATLEPALRHALERGVALLRERLGDDLVAAWLYGSRARGEPARPDSDIDLLVITRSDGSRHRRAASGAVFDAAQAEGVNPFIFVTHLMDEGRLSQRRRISSFFIQEVDRDKIVLFGDG